MTRTDIPAAGDGGFIDEAIVLLVAPWLAERRHADEPVRPARAQRAPRRDEA